jgi:predicted class III extradiol MEMO1 family dioxygenase
MKTLGLTSLVSLQNNKAAIFKSIKINQDQSRSIKINQDQSIKYIPIITPHQTKRLTITSHDEAQQMHSPKDIGDTTMLRSSTDITHFQQPLPNMRSERIAISARTATPTTATDTTTF